MNIFYLDKSPVESAQMLCNKHVVKMIVETAQVLSTAHRVLDGADMQLQFRIEQDDGSIKIKNKRHWMLPDDREEIFYKCTHRNHPSCVWARETVDNYLWLVEHLFALSDEYTYRYSKKHATIKRLGYEIQSPPFNLKKSGFSEPPACMPHEYKVSDVVQSYRNYYTHAKAHILKYKTREAPTWLKL